MTVVAFDTRGSGKSSRPDDPYTLDTLVEDIKDLLDHLELQEPIHLCGFSNGGLIVQKFALKYPSRIKTLMLFESGAYIAPIYYEQYLNFIETFIKTATPAEILDINLRRMFSPSFRKRLKRDRDLYELYSNDMGLVSQLKDPPRYRDYVNQWVAIKGFDTRDLLRTITQPTLILAVFKAKDDMTEFESVMGTIPNATIELLEGIGHGLIIEAPEKVNLLMWNFIKGYLPLENSK